MNAYTLYTERILNWFNLHQGNFTCHFVTIPFIITQIFSSFFPKFNCSSHYHRTLLSKLSIVEQWFHYHRTRVKTKRENSGIYPSASNEFKLYLTFHEHWTRLTIIQLFEMQTKHFSRLYWCRLPPMLLRDQSPCRRMSTGEEQNILQRFNASSILTYAPSHN